MVLECVETGQWLSIPQVTWHSLHWGSLAPLSPTLSLAIRLLKTDFHFSYLLWPFWVPIQLPAELNDLSFLLCEQLLGWLWRHTVPPLAVKHTEYGRGARLWGARLEPGLTISAWRHGLPSESTKAILAAEFSFSETDHGLSNSTW